MFRIVNKLVRNLALAVFAAVLFLLLIWSLEWFVRNQLPGFIDRYSAETRTLTEAFISALWVAWFYLTYRDLRG